MGDYLYLFKGRDVYKRNYDENNLLLDHMASKILIQKLKEILILDLDGVILNRGKVGDSTA